MKPTRVYKNVHEWMEEAREKTDVRTVKSGLSLWHLSTAIVNENEMTVRRNTDTYIY